MPTYFPTTSHWDLTPDNSLARAQQFANAQAFSIDHDSHMDRDIAAVLANGHYPDPPPFHTTLGPTKRRGNPSGIILKKGRIAAQWGDVERVDMTFSISKSYLALCVGLAVDDGLIPDIHAPVGDLVSDPLFHTAQNRNVTWAHLLQLTSEWQGDLFGKPDWIEHNRNVSNDKSHPIPKGTKRDLQAPGTFWEYNDVRVNCLAFALLYVFRRPLPEVLRERIMDPIGASKDWQWHGYETSWVDIDGQQIQSVSGGGHWGGGIWISTLDHARVGLLMSQQGEWQGQQIISRDWIKKCLTPSALKSDYGFLWWLNQNGETVPEASGESFFALGDGSNVIWVDPKNDIVAVVRWLRSGCLPGFVQAVLQDL